MAYNTGTGDYIFVSYSSEDRPLVEQTIRSFHQVGLNIWWDQDLQRGFWGEQIVEKINGARWVVAFLTQNSINWKRDYVLVEMEIAREQAKLIPVRIGEFTIPFAFKGLIRRIQNYTFPIETAIVDHPNFQRLCRACGADPTLSESSIGNEKRDDLVEVAHWFSSKINTIDQVSFALAVAVLEEAPLSQIQTAATDLARLLRLDEEKTETLITSGSDKFPSTELPRLSILTPRSSRLAEIDALVFNEKHARLGVNLECCRFQDDEKALSLLRYVWQELDDLHEPFIKWLHHLAGTLPAEGRMRLGFALGVLAQAQFHSLFEQILNDWAIDEHSARREVTDIAFSVACYEPVIANAIRQIISGWSRNTNSARFLKAAVELSCGYTGMRIPGFAIETLKSAARAKFKDLSLVSAMAAAIDSLLHDALENEDTSLLNLRGLIEELAQWVEKAEVDENQQLPMFLFLHTLNKIPLSAPKNVTDTLSLSSLMADDKIREAFARVFSAALRDFGDGTIKPRDDASNILKRWAERQKIEKHIPDPVLKLARTLVAQAKTKRDHDRCVHLFHVIYGPDDLAIEFGPISDGTDNDGKTAHT